MAHPNIRIAIIPTKNGWRIAGTNTEDEKGITLKVVDTARKMNLWINKLSKQYNIPAYNHALDF